MTNVEGRARNFAQQTPRKKHKSRRPASRHFIPRPSTDYYSATLVCSCHSSHSRVWAKTAPVPCTAHRKVSFRRRLSL